MSHDERAPSSRESRADNHLTSTYPPAQHFLRDLRICIESTADEYQAHLEISPHLCSDQGGVRAGVVATLVDVVAGACAARATAPDWIATCDLVLHMLHPARAGQLLALTRILRRGRKTVVIEVEINNDDFAECVALATVTFSVLEARGEMQKAREKDSALRTDFALPSSGFDRPVESRLGASLVDPEKGAWKLGISQYNSNTLGALQGGGQAVLIDVATESIGRACGNPDWVTTDFTIHYLALGKVGPLRTEARVLRLDVASALVRVEVRDAGADDRLVAVATATSEPLG